MDMIINSLSTAVWILLLTALALILLVGITFLIIYMVYYIREVREDFGETKKESRRNGIE